MTTVHLVFPPVWPTETPYLSLPALAAYLRRRMDATVRSCDLNIAFWMDLRSEANLERLWRWSCERMRRTVPLRGAADVDLALRLSRVADIGLEGFLMAARTRAISMDQIDPLLCLYFREQWLHQEGPVEPPLHDHGYYDPNPLMDAISLAEAASTAEGIVATLTRDRSTNPYLDLMPRLYARAAADERADILGISVIGTNQVVPSFALAHWVKTTYPTTTVLVGGAWTTHVLDQPEALELLFQYVDGFVAGGGERPLAEAVRRVRAGAQLAGIPGVYTRNGASAPTSIRARWDAPLDELPTPDFDDLPLDLYDYPGLLPLQASRGCSWGRCTFCSYATMDPLYRARVLEKVVSDIETLAKRYHLREIAFTDSLMEPRYFAQLSEELATRAVQVKWRGFGRFDLHYSREVLCSMARAGCHLIIWGMESASPRILKMMRKGNTPAIIQENLRDAAKAGIHNRVCLIYGYPGETREDRDATIAFVRRCRTHVHSIAFCQYTAVRDTPMTRAPDDHGLALEANTASLALEVRRAAIPTEYLTETDQLFRGLCIEVERHHARIAHTSGPVPHKCTNRASKSASGTLE